MYYPDDMFFIVITGYGTYFDMFSQVRFEEFKDRGYAGYYTVTARTSFRRADSTVIVVVALYGSGNIQVRQGEHFFSRIVGIYYIEVFVVDSDNVSYGIEDTCQ